jgi:hypothetical protein
MTSATGIANSVPTIPYSRPPISTATRMTSGCSFGAGLHRGATLARGTCRQHIKELFPGGMSKLDFTFQMSDHLPLWIQINTDIDGHELQQIVQG